jgi:hypothetical protein
MMEKKMEDRELKALGALTYRILRMRWLYAEKLERQVMHLQREQILGHVPEPVTPVQKQVKNNPNLPQSKRGVGGPKSREICP